MWPYSGRILLQKGRISQIIRVHVEGRFDVTTLPNRPVELLRTVIYSSGLRNSSPNNRISPAASWRRTFAAMGGVSLGTRLEEAGDGAGMVKCTIWSGRRMCPEDTGSVGADVQSLRQLNELHAGNIRSAQENGHLQTDAWRSATLCGIQAQPLLYRLDFQWLSVRSTSELVRVLAHWIPHSVTFHFV